MKVNLEEIVENKEYCESLVRKYLKQRVLRKAGPGLSSRHLTQAKDNIDLGNFIFDEHEKTIKDALGGRNFYGWCIVIYYYALYHSVLALLNKIGYESKSHAASIAMVTLFYYHKENILSKEDVEFIIGAIMLDKEDLELVLRSKVLRERACYKVDEKFDRDSAEELGKQASAFVAKMAQVMDAGPASAKGKPAQQNQQLKNHTQKEPRAVQK